MLPFLRTSAVLCFSRPASRDVAGSEISLFAAGPPWGPCSFEGALRAAFRVDTGGLAVAVASLSGFRFLPVRRWTPLGSLFAVGPPWGPCSPLDPLGVPVPSLEPFGPKSAIVPAPCHGDSSRRSSGTPERSRKDEAGPRAVIPTDPGAPGERRDLAVARLPRHSPGTLAPPAPLGLWLGPGRRRVAVVSLSGFRAPVSEFFHPPLPRRGIMILGPDRARHPGRTNRQKNWPEAFRIRLSRPAFPGPASTTATPSAANWR